MSLPRIISTNPSAQPAVAEVQFNDAYITNLNISTPPDRTWHAVVTTLNFNYDLNEFPVNKLAHMNREVILDLKAEAARSTLVSQTLGAVLVTVGQLLAERKALKDIDLANAMPDEVEKLAALTAANAALAAARTALGVS
jgi:hypothetical protein